MGTDIHLFVEYARTSVVAAEPRTYLSLTDGAFNLTRDYRVFGAISEVRDGAPAFPDRGLPEDISEEACRAYYHLVGDKDEHDGLWQHVSRSTAEDFLAQEASHRRWWRRLELISDPDAHNASWLTRDELLTSLHQANLEPDSLPFDIRATIAALMTIPVEAFPRVVFWFDN